MKYCDLSCEYAEFPTELADGSLTCRTFQALYCRQLEQLVDKNGPCLVKMAQIPPEQSDTKH